MPLVYPNMQLSEVVEEHPSLIPVINRFGIRLGLGDKSVKTLCEEHSLDTDFLLTVINTFLNEEYFPEKKLQTFHTSQIIELPDKDEPILFTLSASQYRTPSRFLYLDEYARQSYSWIDRTLLLLVQGRTHRPH